MSDQKLQEAWTSFAQTEPGNVLERQCHLDDFLGQLLSSAKEETPLSNLLHFSDVGSVVSLLGGQFLADIEHICLGSVSYDSDASSSATSRSVESIISDASQVSDGSRGCRPRVIKKTNTGKSHSFKDSIDPSQALQDTDKAKHHSELLLVSVDHTKEPSDNTHGLLECTQIEKQESLNTVPAGNKRQVDFSCTKDHDSRKCQNESLSKEKDVLHEYHNHSSCSKIETVVGLVEPGSVSPGKDVDVTETQVVSEFSSSVNKSSQHSPAQASSSSVNCGQTVVASTKNTGQEASHGNEAQNAASLKHYLLHGCGAKILVALDHLGVAGLTGGREISHVLAFIFTFLLKNSTVDESAKVCCTQRRCEKGFLERKFEKERKKTYSNVATHKGLHNTACSISSDSPQEESLNHFSFKYEPFVNPCLDDIFAPIIYPAHTKSNPTGRGSTLSVSQIWIQTSGSKSSSLSSCQSGKKLGKKRRKRYSCIPSVQSDSEGEENIKTSRLGRAIVKFTMNPNDFDYFTRAVYSDEDKCHETETDQTSGPPSEKVCLHDSSLCLSLIELLQCIVSIQTQLAMHEAELKHLSSPLLATHDILQFSLDTFSSMVSELKYLEQKKDEAVDMQVLLIGMLKLVFSSIQRFLKSSELLVTLTELGVVPKLLNLASLLLDVETGPENVLAEDDNEILGAAKVNVEKSNLNNRACLAHEIIIGLLLLLQSCTSMKVEWKDVWQCLHLHKIFLQNHGSDIIKKVVYLRPLLSMSKRSEVLSSLSKLVLYMKYWREDIYHIEKCDKKSHRFCEYQAIHNHHSQVLGTSSRIVNAVDPGACMISNFANIVLDCFASSSEPEIHASSIKALSKCGLCCCMSTRMILSKLLPGLVNRLPHIVSYITLFIENIVWHDLSGLILTDPVRCAFCHIPEHLGTGVNHISTESTTDDSFALPYGSKGSEPFRQLKNYLKEGHNHNILNHVSHWEGIALYRQFIFNTCISSKIMGHITRLVSQSNTGVKLEICEHLIIPALKEICDQGIDNYLASTGYEKDVLVNLIKSFRLTLAESSDKNLLRFLQGYGSGLISACKEIPGIRLEAFALLCNIVKKELKTKPGMPIMSDADEENNLIFTKIFEWEIIEHNEFWSVYFGMKAEEVRQRFFIHTRINVDDNMQDHKVKMNWQSPKGVGDNKADQENRNASESFGIFKELEVEECEVVGENVDDTQEEGNGASKAFPIDELPQSSANELTLIDVVKAYEVDIEKVPSNDTSTLSPSNYTVVDHIKESENDTSKVVNSAGYPQGESGSITSHMNAGSPHPSTNKSTCINSLEEAESGTQKTSFIIGSPHPSSGKSSADESEEEGIKEMNMDVLAVKYAGLGELWAAITEILQTSTEFQAYLAASSVRSIVAPLLINITQDLARSSSGTLSLSSVVLEQLAVTFSLMHSLLTFIIITYPYAGMHVETLLNELRSPLLRYSPRTCGDVKQLVSVMLQCCVLSTSANVSYTLPHPSQHAVELLDEDTGPPGDAGEQQPEETDGYEADTEQLANVYPSSTKSLQDEDDLECPELVLLALDLIINHHERFLESREEERHEERFKAHSCSKADDQDDQPQTESFPGVESHTRTDNCSGAEDHSGGEYHVHDDQSETKDLSEQDDYCGQEDILEQGNIPEQEGLLGHEDISRQQDPPELEDLSGYENHPGLENSLGLKDLIKPEDCSGHETHPGSEDHFIAEDQSLVKGDSVAKSQSLVESHSTAEGHCISLAQSIAIEQPFAELLADVDDLSTAEHQSFAKDQLLIRKNNSDECQEHVEEKVKHKKRDLREGVKSRMRKSHNQNTSVAESNSSTSSVYHTLYSDEDTVGSAEEQVSDWEEYLGKEDRNSGITSGSMKENFAMSSNSSVNDLCSKILHTSCDDSVQKNVEGSQIANETQRSTEHYESPNFPYSRVASSLQASQSGLTHAPSEGGLCCESEVAHSASLTQCVHALLLLCRSSSAVCRRLHSLGFLSRLLDGFHELICADNPDYRDVVGTVVAVWAEVGRWCLTPTELSQFLALFKASAPPLETLLFALSQVLEGSGCEPLCALPYPCHGVSSASISPTLNASHNSLTESLASFVNIRVPSSPVVEAITRLHESHCRHGIISCVAISCVACPVPRTLDWSPYNSGLASTMWLCIRDRSGMENKQRFSPQSSLIVSCRSESYFDVGARCNFSRGATSNASVSSELNLNKLHVLSVGTQHLMFSLWLDPLQDCLQVCVSREVDRESAVLSQGMVMRAGLCDGDWHHVAFCVPTINVRRGGSLKVTIFVDSLTCHSVSVMVPAVGSIKKSSPSYLLLGHTDYYYSEEPQPCHSVDEMDPFRLHRTRRGSLCYSHSHRLLMGNTFLFREPVLSRELCLYLMALGKDCTSLIPLTDKDEKVLMTPYITSKLLGAGMDLSVLYGHMESVIKPAQESLLLLHAAQRPTEFLCYKPHMPTLQDTGNHYPSCTTQTAVLFGELSPQKNQSSDVALLQMGGIAHIVYLFARLVEMRSKEHEQAVALRLLVHCIHTSPQLAAQYEGLHGSSLIFRILLSPLSCPGVQVIKALLDGCTHPSVVQYLACRDVYTVAPHVPAILVDRDLMNVLISNWKTFFSDFSKEQHTKYCVDENGDRVSVLGILLSVLKVLLAEGQPYRDFNLSQLRDIEALDKILFMCKELELTTGSLDGICSPDLIISVVTGLVGGPGPVPWRNASAGVGLGMSAQESYSSGFCSVPSAVGLATPPTGITSFGIGSPVVRVRDVAAVYGFLLLAHPAHLTYAATEQHTAYYLPHIPTSTTSRPGSLVAVGVDLAAELMDCPRSPPTLAQYQTSDWQLVDSNDPFLQLQQIRLEQKEEIRKLRKEGTIVKNAYESSDDEEILDRVVDNSNSNGTRESCLPVNEDRVDGKIFRERELAVSQAVPSVDQVRTLELEYLSEKDFSNNAEIYTIEHQISQKKFLRKTELSEADIHESENGNTTDSERTETYQPIRRLTKWTEDIGETEDDDSIEEEESSSHVNLSCLTQVVVGLLEMMETLLKYSSDTTARTLLAEALYMDQTIVMANHPQPVIRCAILKLFTTMLDRCSPEDTVLHLRQNVPLIIAQQLHKHSAISTQLVIAAFSLALGRSFTFEDYAIDCDPSLALPQQVVLFIPLMALLPHSAQDIALCHNSLMVMLDLLHKNTELIIPLIHKAYFVDSLLCTLKKSLHTEGMGVSDVTGESECEVVVSDITEILSWMINCLVASPQHKNFMLSLEVLHHLNLLCRGESAVCGGQASCVGHLQGTEAALLQVALSRIQATASTHQHTLARDINNSLKTDKTSISGSTSLHNMKLFSGASTREDSDSGVGSVLANYTTIPFTKSLHNISDQLFLNQSRSSPALTPENAKKEEKILSHSELVDRFRVLIQKATDFLFMSAWSSVEAVASALPSASAPETFSLFLLELLLCAAATITQRKGNSERCGWERMVWGCQDILRMHLNHLLALVTSPRTHIHTRIRAAQALATHPRVHAIVSYTSKANPQLLYKVGIFMHELRYQNENKLDESAVKSCETVLQILEECSVQVLPPPELYPPHGAMREWSVVSEEKRQWQDESAKIAILVVDRCNKQDKRLLTKNIHIYEAVARECSRLTRTVVDRQNVERKFVLGGIKHSQCRHVHLTHRWRGLIEMITHERATWHFPQSYSRSWQLDQTEGPMRVRKRLTRGRLHIQARYLMPEYSQKIDIENQPSPLESVLHGSETESAMAVMIERLNVSERIIHMSSATVVSPGMEQRGEILVSRTAMYFVGEQVTIDMNQSGSSSEVVSVTWPLDSVREIHIRRYQLQDCALELFLTTGHSVLLAFIDTQHRNQVIGVLSMSEMPNLSSKATLPEVTTQWREGHMTNFEYLTQLNKLAGRSFNDLMQYPVFPFILSNYTTDILSLNDPFNFRNLRKPIAVQQSHKEQHYINNFEITAQISQDAGDGPYHYGSHYSNSGIVLHFLVRLPPFTQLFLRYQDGNFDIPDRTFHAVQTTWRLASCDSTTDFKELIPEFFFLPEIFLNSEGFNMGVRQSGERVHHVQLPPWSCDDPRRFVLIHRAALESPLVTQNLHHWIDLVFGFKQTGRAAVEAINVFHPAVRDWTSSSRTMYYIFWL
ncbi:uncharacterized protein [Panulirus ornatus]|uniref:uncharacterized protein isoform X2 n=1 Tax=Panulirus ornatus TaxID=150431 RepID=UPI003A88A9FF